MTARPIRPISPFSLQASLPFLIGIIDKLYNVKAITSICSAKIVPAAAAACLEIRDVFHEVEEAEQGRRRRRGCGA
jgi:hypothetical protein